jgi:hypothetical protein
MFFGLAMESIPRLHNMKNEDEEYFFSIKAKKNEYIHSSTNEETKKNKLYHRNEDKPKYLFLNYRRNEDEAKYSFLNYQRNEDEAKYTFLNYRWFDIATVKRPKFDTLFGENIFFLLIFFNWPLLKGFGGVSKICTYQLIKVSCLIWTRQDRQNNTFLQVSNLCL